MLLEKAWAKLFGTYNRASGGFTQTAAMHLTGLPGHTILHKDVLDRDDFWRKLFRAD